MKLSRIEISGFRSFSEHTVIDLSDNNTLNYCTGVNLDNPELGANGAGKSSIWEALCWCLYGATSIGQGGPQVCSWDKTEVRVIVWLGPVLASLFNNGQGHCIVRTWGKQKRVLLNGNEVEQRAIDELIGANLQQFLLAVYISQRARHFMDMRPTEKAEHLSAAMMLDPLQDASDLAKKHADVVQEAIRDLQQRIARKQGALSELDSVDHKREWRLWNKDQDLLVQAARERMHDTRNMLANAKRAVRDCKESLHQYARDNFDNPRRDTELEEESLAAAKAEVQILKDLHYLDANLKHLVSKVEHLKTYNRMGSDMTCQECGQAISRSHVEVHLHKYLEDLSDMRKKHAVLAQAHEQSMLKVEALRKRKQDAKDRQDKQSNTLSDLRHALRRAEDRVSYLERDLKRDVDKLNEEMDRPNPYGRLLRDYEGAKDEAEVVLLHAYESEHRMERQHAALTYWVKGFKTLRLFMIDQAAKSMEIEINNALVRLGLPDWQMFVRVDSETKSGTVRRALTLEVQGPDNSSAVPFESWSGGEAQRLRLAAAMGFSDLLRERLGIKLEIEIWDEPTQGLSAPGISALMQTLAERATRSERPLWVIDHHSLDFGLFGHTLKVRKQGKISTLS